jgi:hypothetical protein
LAGSKELTTQARKCAISESDMDYQLGALTLQQLSLKRKYKSITQAVNFDALGDWETKVKEILADLQASLNAAPQNDKDVQEIFKIKWRIGKYFGETGYN